MSRQSKPSSDELDLTAAKARLKKALSAGPGQNPDAGVTAQGARCCEPLNGWGHTLECDAVDSLDGVSRLLPLPKAPEWSEYEVLIGLPQPMIYPGGTLSITTQPQLHIKLTRLVLTRHTAARVRIPYVIVGNTYQMLTEHSIPGEFFEHPFYEHQPFQEGEEKLKETYMKSLDRIGRLFPVTCEVSQTIRVGIENVSGDAFPFEGALYAFPKKYPFHY